MDFITSIVSGVIVKIAETTVVPLYRQVGYVIHYKSNLQNLRDQVENLVCAKDRRQHTLDDEVKRKGKRVERDVENWLTKVDEITQEVDIFLEDERHTKTKCFHGFCPNPILRYQLSRKSTKLVQKVEFHEKREFTTLSYSVPPQDICNIQSRDYLAFESRLSIVKDIMEKLRNPDTNMIGVYGIGGVGKTTLAKEVYRQATEQKLFDDVIIVLDVKLIPDLEGIQKQILEKLGMEVVDDQSIAIRACLLWDRIKDKRVLIILDDVPERIDLETMGVLNEPNCNLMFTARDRRVLCSEMRTQEDFRLDALGEIETWNLFEKVAGDIVKENPIRTVAKEVAKKCGGLPILVVAVASALRVSTFHEWKDALRKLKKFDMKELAEKAWLTLEWSYNQLNAEELKPLFLLCGIFAWGNYSMNLNDCFKYSLGLGLLKEVDTMEEAQAAFHSLIKKLQNYCLLPDRQAFIDNKFVRMHELVRNVAVMIARRDQHVLVRESTELFKEWPNKAFIEKCTMIFLRLSNVPRLPEVPSQCQELKLFALESRDQSLQIGSNFFKDMKELKVLDLSGFPVPSLPASLQFLTNLQTLCLDRCVLGDIALVGQLRSLKILSLLKSKLTQLPEEIGQLTNLQLLDLTGCSKLVLIPPNVIASLKSLEDLRMGGNSFKQWEAEGIVGSKRRTNSSLSELKQLSKLTALDIHIPDASVLPSSLFLHLERYHVLIGEEWKWLPFDNSFNTLMLKLATRNQLDRGLEMLVKRSEHLYLDVMEGINDIFHLLSSDGYQQLKLLQVQNNAEITYVINHNVFQKLQSLTLINLPKLVRFSSKGGRAVVTTRADDEESNEIIPMNEIGSPVQLFNNREIVMPNITRLIVHQCDGLRFLLSSSMAESLVQLKHLEVQNCQIMEEIVSTEESSEEVNTYNILCKLNHLQLQHLPQLTRFCIGNYIDFPSLEILHVEDCTKLETFIFDPTMIKNEETDSKDNLETPGPYFLFDEKVGLPSLERLVIYDLPKLINIWHNQLSQDSFCILRKVDVQRCHNLINIFAASIMRRLNALDTLQIHNCKSIQLVFELGGSNVERNEDPSATHMSVSYCQNLHLIDIDSCESLKNILPVSVAKGLKQLRKLRVAICNGVETIVAKGGQETTPNSVFPKAASATFSEIPTLMHLGKEKSQLIIPNLEILEVLHCGKLKNLSSPAISLQNLTTLKVIGCRGLECLITSSIAQSLMQLTHLEVKYCERLVQIVGNSSEDEAGNEIAFNRLEHLELSGLPSLQCFFSGTNLSHQFTICDEIEESDTKENPDSAVQYFLFDKKVGLPRLETLIIHDLHKLMTIWHEQLAPDSFCRLKTVDVQRCKSLVNIFGASILGRLNALDALNLRQCQSLRLIFEHGGINAEEEDDTSITPSKLPEYCQNLISVEIDSCKSLRNIFPASVAKGLQQLRKLSVTNCVGVEEIVAMEGLGMTTPEFVFPNATSVKFGNLPRLASFYPGMHASVWPLLGELRVESCDNVEIFALEFSRFQAKPELGLVGTAMKQPLFLIEKGSFSNLEDLHLYSMVGAMKNWWSPHPAELFTKLKSLWSQSPVLQSGFLQNLPHLESLLLYGFEKEVFVHEGISSGEIQAVGTLLPHLKSLTLFNMIELMNLGKENSQPVLPNLEFLQVKLCGKLKNLRSSAISFQNLKTLVVVECHELEYLIPCSIAQSLMQLERMEVKDCQGLIEIVANSNQDDHAVNEIAFMRLQRLELSGLPSLRRFCSGNCLVKIPSLDTLVVTDCLVKLSVSPDRVLLTDFNPERFLQNFNNLDNLVLHGDHKEIFFHEENSGEEIHAVVTLPHLTSLKLSEMNMLMHLGKENSQPIIPNLEILEVSLCGRLENLSSPAISFQNLKTLKVIGCQGLEYLLTSSIALSLMQLTHLEVKDCQRLVEIVGSSSEDKAGNEIAFNKLEHLELSGLPSLQYLFSGTMLSHQFTICDEIEESDTKENLDSAVQYFLFDKKVGLPRLETLIVHDLHKLMRIWHEQLAPDSFCRLKTVDVRRCQSLINIFGASILGRLNALNALKLTQCQSLRLVFEHGGINAEEEDDTSITPSKLPEYCQNLASVEIDSCESLRNIFPASVAKGLQQLRNLTVDNCDRVEEIVAMEELGMTTPKFVFPNATSVKFGNLPRLASFYPGMHASVWPLLGELQVQSCDNVEIFALEFSRFQAKPELGLVGTAIKQPLFLMEKGSFSNLEILHFYSKVDTMKNWWSLLPAEFFSKLKSLWSQSGVFQSGLLQNLPHLESLLLYGFEKEVFVHEGISSGEIQAVGTLLPHLINLWVFDMSELMHLGKENSQPVLPNLESLRLELCGKLKNLRSSAISFQNLKVLKVEKCHGLEYLTTYSIAQTLTQLTHMEVKDCQGLTEIVAYNSNQDDDAVNEIAFMRLQRLELSGLPSLRRFCSGNCLVKIPSLDTLVVTDCLVKLSISPDWVLLTDFNPERFLQNFNNLDNLVLHGDHKDIFFHEENSGEEIHAVVTLPHLTSLKLSEMNMLMHLGKENSQPIIPNLEILEVSLCGKLKNLSSPAISFQNLKTLKAIGCQGLEYLITSSIAQSLMQLTHLEVKDCERLVQIVGSSSEDEAGNQIAFNRLEHLELSGLPSLQCFFSGTMLSHQFTICDEIEESGDSKENLDGAVQYILFDKKVVLPRMETLIVHNLPKLMTIWHDQLAADSFCRLKKVDVQRCQSLINIFGANILGRLNALFSLKLRQCQSLRLVFENGGINAKEEDDTSITPTKLPEYCENLVSVEIRSCESLRNIFPASVAKGLQQLRKLRVKDCDRVEEIVAMEGLGMTTPKFVFPNATSVIFQDLPRLASFYPGMHASVWPLLKVLGVKSCDNVEIFDLEFSRFQAEPELGLVGTAIKQPLFLIEKGSFSNLEILHFYSEVGTMKNWWSLLPAEFFSKLKSLRSQSGVFQSGFLQNLPHLEDLRLYGSEKEVFVHEGIGSAEIQAVGTLLPHLKSLRLFRMPELMHLGKENSQLVIPNLVFLRVKLCGKLKNLRSSAISFQNLKTLVVVECHELEYLIPCSIAQSLIQLEHMEVKDCQGLTEIVANSNQDDDAVNEIAFMRLQRLELSGLPSLQGFCSGNCVVKIPFLDTLTVTECLNELKISPDKVLLSNSKPERLKLIEEEAKDHDKPEGSGTTRTEAT